MAGAREDEGDRGQSGVRAPRLAVGVVGKPARSGRSSSQAGDHRRRAGSVHLERLRLVRLDNVRLDNGS